MSRFSSGPAFIYLDLIIQGMADGDDDLWWWLDAVLFDLTEFVSRHPDPLAEICLSNVELTPVVALSSMVHRLVW